MLELPAELIRRLEAQASRLHRTETELLETWLDAAEKNYFEHTPVGERAILAEAATELSPIFNCTFDSILIVDADGNCLDANPAARELLQLKQETVQQNIAGYMRHSYDSDIIDDWQQLTKVERGEGKLKIVRPDGSARFVLFRIRSNHDSGQHLVILHDVTNREQIDAALIESEKRLRIISEMTSDYSYSFAVLPDLSLRLEWVTLHAFQRLTEYTPAEVTRNGGWASLLHPDDRAETTRIVERFLTNELEEAFEYRIISKSGLVRYLKAINKSVRDDSGRIFRIYGAAMDMTTSKLAQLALERSEVRSRILSELSSDYMTSFVMLPDGQLSREWITDLAFERVTGYSVTESDTIGWAAMIHPEDRPALLALYKRAIEQGVFTDHSTHRIITKDGAVKYVTAAYHWEQDKTGQVVRIYSSISDITERVRYETALRESEQRYRMLADNVIDTIVSVDAQGRITYISPSVQRVLGYKPESLLGHSPIEWTDQAQSAALEAQWNELQAQGAIQHAEYRMRHKDGHYIWIEALSRIDTMPAVSVWRNITERKKADEAFREIQSRYAAVFNNSPVSISVRNRAEGRVVEVNDAFVRLLGYSREDLLSGLIDLSALWESPEERALYQRERAAQNPILQVEHRLRKKSGEVVTVWVSSAVVDINGEACSITFTEDITARKQAEQIHRERDQLRLALEKEHEINQIANSVIRTVSHEFRTPLATIRSATFTLGRMRGDSAEMPYSEKREKRLQVIDNQVTVLDHLIDDISLLIRNLSGQLPFQPTTIQLSSLCSAMIEELQSTLGIRHTLRFETIGEIDRIIADKKLLERILINLLSNAVKYSAPGTTIQLNLSKEQDRAVLRVIDQGWGISPADLELLFTPYFRSDEARGVSGVGLGLSIVRECVVRHHGTITVHSQVDKGTTFTVQLPLTPPTDHKPVATE